MTYASPGKYDPFSTLGKHWPTLKWRPGRTKSWVALLTRNRRMHPLNCSNFVNNSTGNEPVADSEMPPMNMALAALMRFGNWTTATTECGADGRPAFASTSTRIVSVFLTLTKDTRCHWPSLTTIGTVCSSFLRPRSISVSWPSRRISPMKCFCFSFVPWMEDI